MLSEKKASCQYSHQLKGQILYHCIILLTEISAIGKFIETKLELRLPEAGGIRNSYCLIDAQFHLGLRSFGNNGNSYTYYKYN